MSGSIGVSVFKRRSRGLTSVSPFIGGGRLPRRGQFEAPRYLEIKLFSVERQKCGSEEPECGPALLPSHHRNEEAPTATPPPRQCPAIKAIFKKRDSAVRPACVIGQVQQRREECNQENSLTRIVPSAAHVCTPAMPGCSRFLNASEE